MENEKALQAAASELGITVQDTSGLRQLLEEKINELLSDRFDRLISILYRMDVDEKKLRQLLKDNPGQDAAALIAGLVIERQEQKIAMREKFRGHNDTIDENEKW